MTAAGKALSQALESPDDWMARGKRCIKHAPSGPSFWIANGSFFFDGYDGDDTPPCIGLIERHWLHFKARKIISKLRPDDSNIVAAKFAKAAK